MRTKKRQTDPEKTDPGVPDMAQPEDLLVVGYVAGAHGVKGLLRVKPFSDDAEALLTVQEWWLDKPSTHRVKVLDVRDHSDEILASIASVRTREEAEALKGSQILISRSLFPELDEDEFYWVDLIGMKVINQRNEELGIVHNLLDNGVHQVLRVDAGIVESTQKRREILIPFVSHFVGEINKNSGTIAVDWEADY